MISKKRSAISSHSTTTAKQRKLGDLWCGSESKKIVNQDPLQLSANAVCPICNITLFKDNALNNLHIDGCLNKTDKTEDAMKVQKYNCSSSAAAISNVIDLQFRTIDRLPGLILIDNFITEKEEDSIISTLDDESLVPWKHSSFNGHCYTKCFGVRTQFGLPDELRLVRQNDISKGEYDIPPSLQPYIDRLYGFIALHGAKLPTELRDFRPNECNTNSYHLAQHHSLRPHFDDRALSGPVLMNLSIGGAARMTYTKPKTDISVKVPLPRRCLQLVTGAARWTYMHEIKAEDVLDERRLSITWRQSGGKKGILLSEAKAGKDVSSQLNQLQQKGSQP